MNQRFGEGKIRENMSRFFLHRAGSPVLCAFVIGFVFFATGTAYAEELNLQELIDEALRNSPDILASQSRVSASEYRIPQAKSLPDPVVGVGYQNEGWNKYSFGDMQMSWWAFSATQMFPFPGKLSLREEIATKDTERLQESHSSLKLKVRAKVKELYFDLFFAHKDIDILKDRAALFARIEDAAQARYSAGMGQQEEVLLAQTEKYILLEKEEFQKQKIQSLEGMLNAAIGRDVSSPLGKPAEPLYIPYGRTLDELVGIAYQNSPEIKSKERMIAGAEAKVKLAEKGYYPDFTVTAEVMKRAGEFDDIWSLTTAINIPLFYKTKQRQEVNEAKASLLEARSELEATKLMLSSSIRDDYSTIKTAESLMGLYKNGLIPKTYQDFELAIAGYVTGKVEAITTIDRLKALLDYETLYWRQLVEREKAIARIEAVTAVSDSGLGGK